MRTRITAAATLFALAGTASAATLVVGPGQTHTTIGSAAGAAADGDTIKISKGRYFENVTLTTSNVSIVGSGVVWDGNIAGTDGICLTINGSGVKVQGITFRNGTTQINANTGGLTVSKCTFIDAGGDSLYIDGGTTADVTGCRFYGFGDEAVESWATDTTVSKNTIRGGESVGIYVNANGFLAEGNTINHVWEAHGIQAIGADPEAFKNKIFNVGGPGIELTGANAVVSGNTITKTPMGYAILATGAGCKVEKNKTKEGFGGIIADGTSPVVNKNKVSDVFGSNVNGGESGIEVHGNSMTAIGNTVTLGSNDCWGFWFRSLDGTGGGLIENNKASEFLDAGVYFQDTYFCTVFNVSAVNCGSYNTAGIYVRGDDNYFEKLVTSNCENRGIDVHVNCDDNEFVSCSVKNSSGDGYRVAGTNNSFANCTAASCGEGLDNRGTGTALDGGKYRGDRFDITNNGTMTLLDVDYVNGGTTQVSQVDN